MNSFRHSVLWFQSRENRLFSIICTFLTGLLFSKTLLSIAVALFAAHWLLDKSIKQKIRLLFNNKTLLLILSIFLIHILGLIITTNFDYALKDIRIKLPLLVIPIVFASETLSDKYFRMSKNWLYLNLLTAVIVIFFIYFFTQPTDSRKIFPFMNHIRLSIILNIGVFFLLIDVLTEKYKLSIIWKIFILVLILFTLLILVASLNGILIFIITLIFLLLHYLFSRSLKAFFIILGILALFFTSLAFYSFKLYENFFLPPKGYKLEIKNFTAQGNPYTHSHDQCPHLERGMPIYANICYEELRTEWNKRSSIPFDSLSHNKYFLKDVLIRYLTSKALTKDSVGIWSLTQDDIKAIEQGITNVNLVGQPIFAKRFYEVLNSYKLFQHSNDPNDKTLFMRLEFWKAAIGIIYRYPLFGVGTGDVNDEFKKQYKIMNSKLQEKWHLRSHNQYLTIAVAFGILGLLIFIISLVIPPILTKQFVNPYFLAVFVILSFSMLTEDTLETQHGASILSFFYNFSINYSFQTSWSVNIQNLLRKNKKQ